MWDFYWAERPFHLFVFFAICQTFLCVVIASCEALMAAFTRAIIPSFARPLSCNLAYITQFKAGTL